MTKPRHREGLAFARLMMVLSSISPLFMLWAVRGIREQIVPGWWFLGFCAVMILLPNLFLWVRVMIAKRRKDQVEIVVGDAEDHREHLLVYLFAMLLPFYSVSIDTMRDLATHLAAISFVVFLFWHLNMHYMNIFWAIRGYRVFTISAVDDGNPLTGKAPCVLITHRHHVAKNEKIVALRISQSVFLEVDS